MIRLVGLLKKEKYVETASKPYEEFNELLKNERFIHYVGRTDPFTPGIRECIINVQYMHFRPENQRSVLFFTHTVRWAGRVWIIMSVPIEYKDEVEKIAKECGLEFMTGVPALVANGKLETFLTDNGRVFFLNNVPDHPIYRGDPLLEKMLRDAEHKTIDIIMRS